MTRPSQEPPTPRQPPRKRRQQPRKKALNRTQAEQQLARYNRLLDAWVARMVVGARKLGVYRKRVSYYQNRVAEMTAAELAAMEQAVHDAEHQHGRSLRAIDLGGAP